MVHTIFFFFLDLDADAGVALTMQWCGMFCGTGFLNAEGIRLHFCVHPTLSLKEGCATCHYFLPSSSYQAFKYIHEASKLLLEPINSWIYH
jgi:hypothetical protein